MCLIKLGHPKQSMTLVASMQMDSRLPSKIQKKKQKNPKQQGAACLVGKTTWKAREKNPSWNTDTQINTLAKSIPSSLDQGIQINNKRHRKGSISQSVRQSTKGGLGHIGEEAWSRRALVLEASTSPTYWHPGKSTILPRASPPFTEPHSQQILQSVLRILRMDDSYQDGAKLKILQREIRVSPVIFNPSLSHTGIFHESATCSVLLKYKKIGWSLTRLVQDCEQIPNSVIHTVLFLFV